MTIRERPLTSADFAVGLAAYAISSAAVLLAVAFGAEHLRPLDPPSDFVTRLVQYDGTYYRDIVDVGYTYKTDDWSTAPFFPAYPVVVRAVKFVAGVRTDLALVISSHLMLSAALVLLHAYARLRGGREFAGWVVAAAATFPTSFFGASAIPNRRSCSWSCLRCSPSSDVGRCP